MKYIRAKIALLAAILVFSHSIYSAEFLVNSTVDAVDKTPGDGMCKSEFYGCTLRAAVMEANELMGKDVIQLAAGTYTLSLGSVEEDVDDLGAKGDLDIWDDLSIIGEDPAATIISGGNLFRVISLLPRNANATPVVSLDLINLAVTQGGGGFYAIANEGGALSISGSHINDNVAAIFSRNGFLTIENSEINRNLSVLDTMGSGIAALGGRIKVINTLIKDNTNLKGGAGIFAQASSVEIYQSNVSGNQAISVADTWGAGMLFLKSNVIIRDSNISNNQASHAGGLYYFGESEILEDSTFLQITNTVITSNLASYGGGILIWDSKNTGNSVYIEHSEISENVAIEGAGIIYADDGNLNISNSTIANNISDNYGGGLYVTSKLNSYIAVVNTTIANNSSITGANIYNAGNNVSLANTIIANPVTGADCVGNIISLGNNLDSDGSCGLSVDSNDILSTDPLLGVLANNGGVTRTLALGVNSPAIDAGNPARCETLGAFDQRYFYRNDGACDIGAHEFGAALAESGELKFSATEVVINEGDGSFRFSVERVNGSDGAASALIYIRQGSSAVNNEDYIYSSIRLTWLDGDSVSQTISVKLIDNTLRGDDKTIVFGIGSSAGSVTISDDESLTVTIKNDDHAGIVQFSDLEYIVGEDKDVVDVFVTRTEGTQGVIPFVLSSDRFATVNGEIKDGQSGVHLLFDITHEQDDIVDGDSIYELHLLSVGNDAVLGEKTNAKIIIQDDDIEPILVGKQTVPAQESEKSSGGSTSYFMLIFLLSFMLYGRAIAVKP